MQTTLENKGWARASRMTGAMTYYRKTLGSTLVWALAALAIVQLISFAIGLGGVSFSANGVEADLGIVLAVAFVCACWITGKGTTFLTRFGTPRTSSWLGGLLSLILWMAALLLGTLLLSLLVSAVTLLLGNVSPERFRLISYSDAGTTNAEVFGSTLVQALRDLPWQILWVAEWSCVFYFLGACLRRNRWLTIGILVGLPMLAMFTMLVPAVRQAVAVIESASESQMAVLGLKWLSWLSRAAQWIERNWQWVQAGAAVVALPLSWLIMRRTPQP